MIAKWRVDSRPPRGDATPPTPRRVVLTFDDGPHPDHTPELLDVLVKEGITAIFFVCGKHVSVPAGRRIVARAASDGHVIGNHAYSHRRLTGMTRHEIRSEIQRTHELVTEFEPAAKIFRPPYGSSNRDVEDTLAEFGYRLVLWDVDSGDWQAGAQPVGWIRSSIEQIVERPSSIVLAHDKCATTVRNFPQFLSRLRARSAVEFVTAT